MLTMASPQYRSEEYRTRASQAQMSADQSMLEHVRQKHLDAAAVWTDLADREDARIALRATFSTDRAPAEATL
jgi:hypothetical protein